MNIKDYSTQRCWRKGLLSGKLLKLGLSTMAIALFVNNVKATDVYFGNAIKDKVSNAKKFDTTITGKVTDENGDVLPGVGIKLKNGTATATTDASGNFSITIPANVTNPVLVISYIGYTS